MAAGKESMVYCALAFTCLHPEVTGKISILISLAKASPIAMLNFRDFMSRKKVQSEIYHPTSSSKGSWGSQQVCNNLLYGFIT